MHSFQLPGSALASGIGRREFGACTISDTQPQRSQCKTVRLAHKIRCRHVYLCFFSPRCACSIRGDVPPNIQAKACSSPGIANLSQFESIPLAILAVCPWAPLCKPQSSLLLKACSTRIACSMVAQLSLTLKRENIKFPVSRATFLPISTHQAYGIFVWSTKQKATS